MRNVRPWRAFLAGCIVAGCAAQDGQTRAPEGPVPVPSVTGRSACFYAREAQDFRVLDGSNVIIYAPNEANAYHLRISPPSPDLRDAESLAFLPAGGRICGHAGERLIIGPSGSGERLAIIDVARLSPSSLQMLRGEGDGGAARSPRPQPGPGADIEGAATPPAPGKADSGVQR